MGGSLNFSEEQKSGGGGNQWDSSSGGGSGTLVHGAGGVMAENGRIGSGRSNEGNVDAGVFRSRYNTLSRATMPSMIIKGRWVRDVLHCDKGVWAFPNGVVYIGRFRNGARDATRACVWWPDGSVLESGWCGDAPSGAGIWYQRDRITPVYRTIRPNALRPSQSLRMSEKAPSSTSNGTTSTLARDSSGMAYLLKLFGSGLIGHGTRSAGDGGGDMDSGRSNDQPRVVLVDFGNHFTFSCSWCPYTMDLNTYAAVVLPQIGSRTAPLPSGTPWPQLYHSQSMSAAVGGNGAGLQAPAPWSVPTAKKISSCANSLHLAGAPSSVVIGRASGAGVVYFDSGVVLAGEWLGNVPRLAIPYRPWSAFDHFITWQMARAASRNCSSTVPRPFAPRLQSCYTSVLAAAPEDVSGEPRRVCGGRLAVASSPLAVSLIGDAAEHARASSTSSSQTPSPDARCTLCGKDYSFFRKRLHCTLCLRSTCSSCLGYMDTEGPAQQEDVKALLRHAYLTAEQTVQLSAAATVKTALTNASSSAARPITFPSFSAEQVDHAFDKKSISTVPVCADCARAVLWKLRHTQLWIPMSMFASVVEGNKHHRETRRDSGVKDAHHDAHHVPNKNDVADNDVDDDVPQAVDPLFTPVRSQESCQQLLVDGQSLSPSSERSAATTTVLKEVEHHTHIEGLPAESNALRSAAADSAEASTGVSGHAVALEMEGATVDGAAHDLLPATRADAAVTDGKPPTSSGTSTSTGNGSAVSNASPARALPSVSTSTQAPNLSSHEETVRHSYSKILPSTQYITYSGYTSHNIPHVYGELWWGRQYYYRGGFCAGERHGFGTQYMPNGEWYEGGFERDTWHGEGVYYIDDGSVLLGEFRKGKLHVVHYRGEAEESDTYGVRPHGRGIGYSPDGSVYNGEWVHGQRHGTGMLNLADGSSVYTGTFVSDAMEGMGKLVTTSGAYYGEFSQNKQNGKGLLFTANCVVEGSWVQGTSSGFTRIYERATGEVYETTYCDGNERDDCFTAPVMIDDDNAAECGQCGTAFSFFLRRHHCRLCGDVFCDSCTQHRASLPPTVTGDTAPSAKSEPGSSSVSGASGQQLRVCDACFFRLSQRRMIALRRYADGSVYAGCWSQGRWVSRGLYCRPDGVFVVMDTYGHALLPLTDIAKEPVKEDAKGSMKEQVKSCAAQPSCSLGVVRRPARTTGLPVSASILQDAAPAKELLDGVSESSSRKDLDAFLLWWATTRSRCGLQVPLDVSLVIQYQRMPAQMLRGKEVTVKAGSEAAAYLAAPARCTLEIPHTPPPRPIRLFITLADSRREMQAMVEGELKRTSASAAPAETVTTPAPESRLSIEEKRTMDSDVEAAALRASRFMPVAIPRAPVVPITAATMPVTGAEEQPVATTAAHSGNLHPSHQASGEHPPQLFGLSAWAMRPPPSIDSEDISDESLVEMMQAERLSWSGAAPASRASAASTIPPLIPPTPAPPTPGLNTTVPWDVWVTRDVPRYAPPPLETVAADVTPATRSSEEKASGGGEITTAPTPSLRSEADMYFACSFWGPTVPDAQSLLEQGKMTQATKLMRRLQQQHKRALNPQQQKQGSDGDSSDNSDSDGEDNRGKGMTASGVGKARRGSASDDPESILQRMQGGAPNVSASSWETGHLFSSEQRAQGSDGWAPTPMRGPFVFDISAHERHRSADGQRWYAKVTQREVLNM
ncbi:FYVE zinc finger, putative [Leishmania tarentolae]|uniref:FYVE zinc finger, putative n=1 Tax=Leishmania tarentolae TaxID=5689 RepID=A0A640KKC8_LEITA|nr:FYVE zinc finger, putative [Leishmania tarentolae]